MTLGNACERKGKRVFDHKAKKTGSHGRRTVMHPEQTCTKL